MSESGDKANNGNNPGTGLASGNNMPNGDEVTLAQTSLLLLLDQASLDAIISGVSWKIMCKHRSTFLNYKIPQIHQMRGVYTARMRHTTRVLSCTWGLWIYAGKLNSNFWFQHPRLTHLWVVNTLVGDNEDP